MWQQQQPNVYKVNNNQIYVIQELRLENKSMEKEYRECKKTLNELSDELNISISCYKEMMFEKRAFNLANTPQFMQQISSNTNPNICNYYRYKSYLLPPMFVNASSYSSNNSGGFMKKSPNPFMKLNDISPPNTASNHSNAQNNNSNNETNNQNG